MNEITFLKFIGENIVRIRKEKGLSQVELANRMGMEDSALRRIEKGRVNSSVKILKKIADELEIDIIEFFKK